MQLLRLAHASNRINAVTTLEEAARAVADEACSVVGAHMGAVRLPASARDLESVTAVSLSEKYSAWWNYKAPPNGTGIYSVVLRQNKSLRLTQDELERHPGWKGFGTERGRHPPLRGMLAVPIAGSDGRNLGVLQLSDRYSGDFTEFDEVILSQIARMASLVVERFHLAAERNRSERMFRTTFEHAAVGMLLADSSGRMIAANQAFGDLTGYDSEELTGMPVDRLFHPDDRALEGARIEALRAGRHDESAADVRLTRKDGETVWIRASSSTMTGDLDERNSILLVAQEIGDQKETEAALGETREEIDRILDRIADGFVALDNDGLCRRVNEAATKILKRDADELLGKNLWYVVPELGEVLRPACRQAIETHEERVQQFKVPGRDTWLEARIFPNGQGCSLYIRDVTERVKVDEEIADQKAALESAMSRIDRIVTSSLDIITTIDKDGHIIEVSPRSRDIWGYDPEELAGRDFIELVHPDDRNATRAEMARLSAGEMSPGLTNRYIRKDGNVVHMQWASVWSPEDAQFVLIGRDVTSRVEAEAKLRQAQRLDAVGQLTGGIAHDFNNLLMVILGTAELMLERARNDREMQHMAETIRSTAERGAELTNRLLAFGRKQVLMPRNVELGEFFESIAEDLIDSLGETVAIDIMPIDSQLHAFVDPGHLEAAIHNVVVNSRDAMPDGGHLAIELETINVTNEHGSDSRGLTPGEYVALAISDSGTGMSEAVRARAFEPFFTTKEVGKGTGLGLSMVYGFAKQSGGNATIESEPGGGTRVTMYLPCAPLEAADKTAPIRVEETEPAPGRILVAEDNAAVRSNVTELLTGMGYRVTAAGSSREAMEALEKGTPFDLLFTNIIMPGGLNGFQLAREAMSRYPRMRILFTSGYVEASLAELAEFDTTAQLLKKPYRRAELAEAVRAALAGNDRRSRPPV